MMREGWEYKKLGDCFYYIKNGANIKQKKDVDGYPITRIETLSGGVFNRDRVGYAGIHDLSKYAEYILESKDLLMSHINSKTYIGRTVEYKSSNKETIIHGMNLLRLKANLNIIDSTFFAYYTQSGDFKSKIARIRKDAVNQSSFAISDLKRFDIPLPPKSTQLAIVSELDKINELIRLKKEQLKDFDNLAQSIFYEMFGDPVENEKGWEVKKLGEVCDIFAGGDKPNDIKATKDNEYIYPVIANGEGEKGILGYTKKCRVIKNAVTIGARGASIGNCRIVKDGFTPAIRLLTLIPSEKLDCPFLFYIVKGLDYKQNGAGQAQLTVPNIKNESIPLPPLPLQHLFALRIEQIEHQKAEVQKAITDLETLLASRMQYWFE